MHEGLVGGEKVLFCIPTQDNMHKGQVEEEDSKNPEQPRHQHALFQLVN
jgi:hypothetical protein